MLGAADPGLGVFEVAPNVGAADAPNVEAFAAPNDGNWELLALLPPLVAPENLNASDELCDPVCPKEKVFCGAFDCNEADPEN